MPFHCSTFNIEIINCQYNPKNFMTIKKFSLAKVPKQTGYCSAHRVRELGRTHSKIHHIIIISNAAILSKHS